MMIRNNQNNQKKCCHCDDYFNYPTDLSIIVINTSKCNFIDNDHPNNTRYTQETHHVGKESTKIRKEFLREYELK